METHANAWKCNKMYVWKLITSAIRSVAGSWNPYCQSTGKFSANIKFELTNNNIKIFFSGRKILIARELTKIHESFYREDIDRINMFKSPIRGELTVVISEKNIKDKFFDEEKIFKKAKLYLKKYSLKDTVNIILETEKIKVTAKAANIFFLFIIISLFNSNLSIFFFHLSSSNITLNNQSFFWFCSFLKYNSNVHFAMYLVDKNYHKIWTCYDFMQEKPIIFLSTKACYDR